MYGAGRPACPATELRGASNGHIYPSYPTPVGIAHSRYFGTCYRGNDKVQEGCTYHWCHRNMGLGAGSCLAQVPYSCINSSHRSFMSFDGYWSAGLLPLAWISVKQGVIHFYQSQTLQFIGSHFHVPPSFGEGTRLPAFITLLVS